MPPTPPSAPLMPHPTPVQACSGQEWYYCRSAWHVISLWVRLMFCHMYPPSPPYAPSVPPGRGIWWPRVVWTCIPLTWAHVLLSAVFNRLSWFTRVHPTPVQAFSAQEWYYCRSAWHLVSLWVKLMFGQMYPHPIIPLCPLNVPHPTAIQTSSGQEQYYIRSMWHLVSLWVRLTCLCEGKFGASSCGNSGSMSGY